MMVWGTYPRRAGLVQGALGWSGAPPARLAATLLLPLLPLLRYCGISFLAVVCLMLFIMLFDLTFYLITHSTLYFIL